MLKTLVTGGSGFIGDVLVRYLESRGCHVVTFDTSTHNDRPSHVTGSILNRYDVENACNGKDIVFHLAGLVGTTELIHRASEATEVNICGTLNVLEACLKCQVRKVFFATIPTIWLNTYSITKRAGADFARMYARWKGLDVRILRWLNVYGPGQKAYPVRKAVPTMILQALHGREIEIWGSGEQAVYLVFVEDLVRNTALYCLEKKADSVPRDTGNAIRMSVNQLALLIRQLTNSNSAIRHLPMRDGEDPTTPLELITDPTAADLLGLAEATTPVQDGLHLTIDYYSRLSADEAGRALEFHRIRP